MRQPTQFLGAVERDLPGAIPRVVPNPPTPKMPHPAPAFRKDLEPSGRMAPQDMDVNPMAKHRVPNDPSDNAYTEIRKMGAYRAFMNKAHDSMGTSNR